MCGLLLVLLSVALAQPTAVRSIGDAPVPTNKSYEYTYQLVEESMDEEQKRELETIFTEILARLNEMLGKLTDPNFSKTNSDIDGAVGEFTDSLNKILLYNTQLIVFNRTLFDRTIDILLKLRRMLQIEAVGRRFNLGDDKTTPFPLDWFMNIAERVKQIYFHDAENQWKITDIPKIKIDDWSLSYHISFYLESLEHMGLGRVVETLINEIGSVTLNAVEMSRETIVTTRSQRIRRE